jgi:hypothetical protein
MCSYKEADELMWLGLHNFVTLCALIIYKTHSIWNKLENINLFSDMLAYIKSVRIKYRLLTVYQNIHSSLQHKKWGTLRFMISLQEGNILQLPNFMVELVLNPLCISKPERKMLQILYVCSVRLFVFIYTKWLPLDKTNFTKLKKSSSFHFYGSFPCS